MFRVLIFLFFPLICALISAESAEHIEKKHIEKKPVEKMSSPKIMSEASQNFHQPPVIIGAWQILERYSDVNEAVQTEARVVAIRFVHCGHRSLGQRIVDGRFEAHGEATEPAPGRHGRYRSVEGGHRPDGNFE